MVLDPSGICFSFMFYHHRKTCSLEIHLSAKKKKTFPQPKNFVHPRARTFLLRVPEEKKQSRREYSEQAT